MPLATVGDYLAEARIFMQDQTAPYRYSDADIKRALGTGLYEARRLRPDLFMAAPSTPMAVAEVTTATGDSTAIAIDPQYRMPLLDYVVGHVQFRDVEDASKQASIGHLTKFHGALVGVLQGGGDR